MFINSPALLCNEWARGNKMDPVHKKLHTHTHTHTHTHLHIQTSALHKLSAIRLCGSYSTRSDQYLSPHPHTATGLKGLVARERERERHQHKERKKAEEE